MSLEVETGSGSATAESFASVADADTRLAALGMTNWALPALSTTEKESALRRATQYMEQAYRSRWQGCRTTLAQGLSWPRYGVYVEDFPVQSTSVPVEVRNACIDLAFKAAAGDLNADLTRGVVREKVGPIETEFDRYSPQTVRYPAIDQMLAPYLTGGGAMVRLNRA